MIALTNIRKPIAWVLPLSVKKRLKKSRDKLFYGSFFPVDKTVFQQGLHGLGIQEGDVVFVHSSFDQMLSIRATPLEIVEILCEAVGPSGTVVMPTFPMDGLSQDYLDQHPFFDWRRTPSRSGILTEILRRMSATERSVHPTHPVAARGAMAKWLTEGHERSQTPFDEHSPFQKLFELDALTIRIGQFEAMTFRHLADYLIQTKVPYSLYSDRQTKVQAIGKDGNGHIILTRAHNPNIACDHQVVLNRMAREGLLRTSKAGRVPLTLCRIQEYVSAYHRYYAQGLFRHYLKYSHAASTINP